jgi:hypothetical protein
MINAANPAIIPIYPIHFDSFFFILLKPNDIPKIPKIILINIIMNENQGKGIKVRKDKYDNMRADILSVIDFFELLFILVVILYVNNREFTK